MCPSGSGAVRDAWCYAIRCVFTVALLAIATPSAAAASSWGAVLSLPSPTGGGLGGVSCTSETACVTVGAIAARWNGRQWSKLPNVLADGVSCTSRAACIAVGDCYCSGFHTPRAARWNGREWSRQRVPHKAGVDTVLGAVSCTSRSACTAVGYTRLGSAGPYTVFVERFDGRRWSVQAAPTPTWAANAFLNGVSCVSPTLCIAVGMSDGGPFDELTRPLAVRWDGKRWAIEHTPRRVGSTSTELSSVSCSSSTACTAVGEADDGTFVERWNGIRWQIQPSPDDNSALENTLSGVSCASATVCVAIGATNLDVGGDDPPPRAPLAERWDGRHWSLQQAAIPPGESWLNAVSCAAKNACVAVGGSPAGPIVERYS